MSAKSFKRITLGKEFWFPDPGPGRVFLAGAGPGDAGLLTVRADEVLRDADAVVYDYLVNPQLLERVPPHCEKIYAGKQKGRQELSQEEIGALLIERARAGKLVVRLKGGDPYIFGRGGEEALQLAAAGVPFESIPGVTSGAAAPAYAGIPLAPPEGGPVTFITGHQAQADAPGQFSWSALARLGGTIVIFMGVSQLQDICGRLLAEGLPPATPAAIIEWGTYPRQRTVAAGLAELAGCAAQAGIHAPAIVVVGAAARMRAALNWFETRPLFGRRVLLTQSARQCAELSQQLAEFGAEAVACPLIAIAPPVDPGAVNDALRRGREFDWIVFTSANAVEYFFAAARSAGLDARCVGRARIAAVGAATGRVLERAGLRADLIPEEFSAGGLAAHFARHEPASGRRVLFPCGDQARPELEQRLAALGARVERVVCYHTREQRPDNFSQCAELLRQERLDAALFSSPSAARHFFKLLDEHAGTAGAAVSARVQFIAIGPTTAQALRELGVPDPRLAPRATNAGLIEALCDPAARQGQMPRQ